MIVRVENLNIYMPHAQTWSRKEFIHYALEILGHVETLLGFRYGDWTRLLRENRFSIDRKYWKRVASVTLMSLATSKDKRKEDNQYAELYSQVQVKNPIFIIGHWRSGTTLIHTLLSQDTRFAYPNLFQVTHPHTFLIREEMVNKILANNSAEKRHMDNMRITFKSPGEDEPALAVMSLRSAQIGWLFPNNFKHYERYLSFDDAADEDLERWKAALTTFSRKLTFRYNRPILFKSPTHTAKIRILLDLFPDARFVHIYRDPYEVFQSTKNMYEKVLPDACLQEVNFSSLDNLIVRQHRLIYDAYFRDVGLLASNRVVDICYEELIEDKIGQVRKIYETLELPEFSIAEPSLKEYIESVAGYKKNPYPDLRPEERRFIAQNWERSFDIWGYPV